jgi:hypothetical protein
MMSRSFGRCAIVAVTLALWWVVVDHAAAQLCISEFRVRGPNGANDEFIEIYNTASTPHTVATTDGSSGYAVAAAAGGIRFVIPNGTVIPPHGHFLGVNTIGYSIGAYPAGTGVASGDATYTTDIADNAGIALFSTSNTGNFSANTRMDAVGAVAEANALYKEGNGYPTLTPFSINYSFYRDHASGATKDTDNNASDFVFVDTNGTSAGAGQRLGAPAPENASSPIAGTGLGVSLLNPSVPATSPPNLVRDLTSDPANNSTFGTVVIRRTITNSTATPLTRLRFRVSELTTFPSPSGIADLRPYDSPSTTETVNGVSVTVLGTTLEEPPAQPNGGGFNSTMSVLLSSPLPSGASVSVQMRFGVQQTGKFRVCGNLEAGPTAGAALGQVGNTEPGGAPGAPCLRETPPAPPVNTALPSVSDGAPREGSAVSASLGTWTGPGLIVYGIQWQRCDGSCADIAGAAGNTYMPGASDVGKSLRVHVMAANVGGIVAADSAPTAPVLDGTAPAMTASTDGAVKKGVVSVTLTCPGTETSCTGTVRFLATTRKGVEELGSAPFSLAGGSSQTVPVTLSKRGRKRRLQATMVVDVADAAGNTATLEQGVSLKKSK